MTKAKCVLLLTAGLLAALGSAGVASDRQFVATDVAATSEPVLVAGAGNATSFRANLTALAEVPALLVPSSGSFRAWVEDNGGVATALHYELQYSLGSDVRQAHIHIGQTDVNGSVIVFLCSNLGNGPAGTPLCEGLTEGAASGVLTDTEVIPVQGGETLDDVVRGMRSGVAYVNVHSATFPSGEVRGQVRRGGGRPGDGDGDDDDDDGE